MFDQYSLLHLATGIVAYFWGMGILYWTLGHSIFEILENTPYSVYFVNHYITMWPGGKEKVDSPINMLGDTISAVIGWYIAYYIDFLGVKYKWYEGHLV